LVLSYRQTDRPTDKIPIHPKWTLAVGFEWYRGSNFAFTAKMGFDCKEDD